MRRSQGPEAVLICECISVELFTKITYASEMEGRRDRDRLYSRWLDGVKKVCNVRSLKFMCIHRDQSRDFVNGANDFVVV